MSPCKPSLPARAFAAALASGLSLAAGTLMAAPETERAVSEEIRLIPPLEGSDIATLGVESDGTRRLVAHGLRLLVSPDGSVETARQFFPLSRSVQALELPARLGNGFVFTVSASGRTAIWKAPRWTGLLEPFAELDFEIERLVPAFDRLYVQARRSGEWAALDAATGKGIDLGSLPRSPNYGAMAFVDAWFGAVELPIRGTMVSFDAGNRWHRLGLTPLALGVQGGELMVVTPEGRRLIARDGSQRPTEAGSSGGNLDGSVDGARRVAPESPLGPLPIRTAVLRGFPDTSETAVVAARGALARIRISDGRILELREKALSPASVCTAVRLGPSFGFVCGEPQGKTQILAFERPLGLRQVEEFATPRAIAESGNGGLVIRGACGATAQTEMQTRTHCIRSPSGRRWELAPHAGSDGKERIVALSDGRAVRIAPPRPGHSGTLIFANPQGNSRNVTLAIVNKDLASSALLRKGFWLDGFVQAADTSLRGWVTGQGLFAGVRIELDGKVRVGPVQRSIERVVLSGERALIAPAAGLAEQSSDGGQTWSDADLPLEIESDASKVPHTGSGLEQGCSRLGCAFLGWLRIGWNGPGRPQPLPVAPPPKATAIPTPGGGRWILRCSPTGEASPVIRTRPAPPTVTDGSRGEAPAPWLPLLDERPPPLSRDALGFDTGNEGQLRAYAWAPRGAEFGKAGKFAVSVLDRYRIRDTVWATRPARSPWADAVQVAEVFGYEGATPAVWNVALDSSGRAGVLSVSSRGTTDLFAVEEDRVAQLLVNAARHGIGSVSSAVRLGTTYYVAAQEDGRSFRVFALEPGRARWVGQYSDVTVGRTITPVLVRSTRGDALGIWGRGPGGWYVFPIHPTTGATERALEISARTLSRMPRPCNPDEEGYLLEGPVGLDPYAEFQEPDALSARAFEGRFIVSAQGICLSELSASAETAAASAARAPTGRAASPASAPTSASVPLVVSDRPSGRRSGYRCAP